MGVTKAEHDKRLRKALQRIKEKGLTLNQAKCEFSTNKITFMGHVMSKNGIGPTSDRIKSLLDAKEPTSGSEVKSFLGLVNFSARYIPNLATVSEPLRRLTKKNVTPSGLRFRAWRFSPFEESSQRQNGHSAPFRAIYFGTENWKQQCC